MATLPISNTEDIIDSRAIIARIADLESEHADECPYDCDDGHHEPRCGDDCAEEHDHLDCPDIYEHDELDNLKALAEEASGYALDWLHGEALVRDSYFEEYAEEFACDIGVIQRDGGWPLGCIDWAKAADELKQDYTSVMFDGVEYWIR